MAKAAARRSEEEKAPPLQGDAKLHALPRRRDLPAHDDAEAFVPETKSPPKPTAPEPAAKQPRKRGSLRRILLIAGPVLVIAGALYLYLTGGRFASTIRVHHDVVGEQREQTVLRLKFTALNAMTAQTAPVVSQ